jgi:hypothetical protein
MKMFALLAASVLLAISSANAAESTVNPFNVWEAVPGDPTSVCNVSMPSGAATFQGGFDGTNWNFHLGLAPYELYYEKDTTVDGVTSGASGTFQGNIYIVARPGQHKGSAVLRSPNYVNLYSTNDTTVGYSDFYFTPGNGEQGPGFMVRVDLNIQGCIIPYVAFVAGEMPAFNGKNPPPPALLPPEASPPNNGGGGKG